MLSTFAKVKNVRFFSAVWKNLLQVRPQETCCSFVPVKTIATTNAIFARGTRRSLSVEPVEEEPVYYPLETEGKNNLGKIIGLNPEDVEIDETIHLSEIRKKRKSKNPTKEPRLFKNNLKESDEETKIKSQFKFIKLGKNGDILRAKIPNLKSKKWRDKAQEIVLEGKRLINEALAAGCVPVSIFFSREQDLENLKIPGKVKLYKVSYKKIQLWSDVVNSQGVVGIFKMPNITERVGDARTIPLTVICDNIRDPGNLGAILRVVTSVGCEQIILTKGCVDIWDSKVLRAGAGCQFRIPVTKHLNWEDVERDIGDTELVLLADNVSPVHDDDSNSEVTQAFKTTENTNDTDLPLECYASLDYCTRKTVIVIGGETKGLSDEAYAFARKRQGVKVGIPMSNNVESLNTAVALGILCYEVRRQWEFSSKRINTSEKNEPEKEN